MLDYSLETNLIDFGKNWTGFPLKLDTSVFVTKILQITRIETMKNTLLGLVIIGSLLVGEAMAGSAFLTGQVIRTVRSDDSVFGGCMAQLNVQIATTGLDCPRDYVTFSCSGDFVPKSNAATLFESAQLSLLTGRKVTMQVTDDLKHNSFCFVSRVDNF